MTAYVVVDGKSLIDLEEKVTKFLEDGYLPAGGVYHAVGEGNAEIYSEIHRIGYNIWLQAVYKIEDKA